METGFFKLLWRFNAFAIALAALVVLAFGAMLGLEFANAVLFGRKTTRVVNVDPSREATETSLRFGRARGGASGVLRLSLLQDQRYDYGLSSKGSNANTVNVAFVETETGRTSWLLPDNSALILAEHSIGPERDGAARALSWDEREDRARAIIYAIVRADSSGDGFLSASDRVEIAAGLPDNSRFEVLVPDADSLDWVGRSGDDGASILYTDPEGTKLARLTLADLSITGTTRLLPPQPD